MRIQLHLSFDGRDFFKIFFFYLAQWSLAASWWTERSILLDTWHNCTPCCLVPCKFVIVFLFLNGKYRFSVQSLSLDFEYFAWFHRFLILFLYFTLWSRCTVTRKRGKKKKDVISTRQFLVTCFFSHKLLSNCLLRNAFIFFFYTNTVFLYIFTYIEKNKINLFKYYEIIFIFYHTFRRDFFFFFIMVISLRNFFRIEKS